MKIYEAMAMGKVVVATTIGAEGLDVRDGKNICLADKPEEFANVAADFLSNHERRIAMEGEARNLVEINFGWSAVAERFSQICYETLEAHELKTEVRTSPSQAST